MPVNRSLTDLFPLGDRRAGQRCGDHDLFPVLIILTDRDRVELESLARARKAPLRMVQRAWLVLAAADGRYNAQIARDLGTSTPCGPGVAGSQPTR